MTKPKDWGSWPVLCFDTETTGVDVFNDRIVQLALVHIQPGARPVSRTMLVDPGVDIPEAAAAVHGITREHAAANATHADPAQMLFEAAGQIALWLGKGYPLLGMNLAYDLTLFEVECRRHGIDGLHARLDGKVAPIVDVLVLDKYVAQYRKGGRKLVDLCRVYDVRHTGAHDATADALACARIWPKLMAANADRFPGMTLQALHMAQVSWRRNQQLSLRSYFERTGKAHDGVDVGWPFHSQLQQRLRNIEAVA